MKIIECVPNFSEGRDPAVIAAIAEAARSVSGAAVLDVDPGKSTHRTVYTIAGEPAAVLEAAFRAIRRGFELIDMSRHSGEHPRQGACDVCPFVPIEGVSLKDCVALAERLGERVGRELQVPVYLYASAARRSERRLLPDIRSGEYEALKAKLEKPEWKPDFGPNKFVPRFGAITIGARDFLIAYNVNLNSPDASLAKRIAAEVRGSGKIQNGERIPGRFPSVQGGGWFISEFGRAQITLNLLDRSAAPIHTVFDACRELAAAAGARVTGSEIVGMIPKKVLLEAGEHYLKTQGKSRGVSEKEKIRTAVLSLGLSDIAPFKAEEKVIELKLKQQAPLSSSPVENYIEKTSSSSPTPGGGSAAALAGSLSAALSAMVASLSFGKKGLEKNAAALENLAGKAHALKDKLLAAVDQDSAAFDGFMKALSLPKKTKPELKAREKALETASKEAALVPTLVLEGALEALELSAAAALLGHEKSLSDAGTASALARAAASGAHLNVLINLQGYAGRPWARSLRAKSDLLFSRVRRRFAAAESSHLKRLKKELRDGGK